MNKIFVNQVVEDQTVDSVFLVTEKRVAETRSGAPYLRLRLSDRTGEIEGRVWEQAAELAREFDKDDYVRSKGRITRYQDALQLVIYHIERLPASTIDPSDFLPTATRDIETMWEELRTIAQGLENESLRDLLNAFGEDPDREGLVRTPIRVAQMYSELLAGYRTDPIDMVNEAIFEITYVEMVLVRDIEFYSLCEHHMLPFIGRAHVAYIPRGKVIGLSKIPRIVDLYARRLQ